MCRNISLFSSVSVTRAPCMPGWTKSQKRSIAREIVLMPSCRALRLTKKRTPSSSPWQTLSTNICCARYGSSGPGCTISLESIWSLPMNFMNIGRHFCHSLVGLLRPLFGWLILQAPCDEDDGALVVTLVGLIRRSVGRLEAFEAEVGKGFVG